jgi:uncharacterized membrane protein YdjX (TVP38/TMEM64 family)
VLPPPSPTRAQWRFILFLGVVAFTGIFALARVGHLPLTPETVRDEIRSWGPAAPLIFAGAFVIRPFVFFPSTLLFLAGGVAFGVGWGTLYAVIGGTLGSVIGFLLARTLGHDFVRAQLGKRLTEFQHARWGMGVVLLLNLIPVVPITAINYAAGLSGMELLPFAQAVAAGLTPRAFAYSYFGNSLLEAGWNEFLISIAMLAALLVIPLYVRRHMNRNASAHPLRRAS